MGFSEISPVSILPTAIVDSTAWLTNQVHITLWNGMELLTHALSSIVGSVNSDTGEQLHSTKNNAITYPNANRGLTMSTKITGLSKKSGLLHRLYAVDNISNLHSSELMRCIGNRSTIWAVYSLVFGSILAFIQYSWLAIGTQSMMLNHVPRKL